MQLLQLQHAHSEVSLRTTNTPAGLSAARAAGLISSEQADMLDNAWDSAARLRNATLLWRGRAGDAVPEDARDADGVGRIVGRDAGLGASLTEAYLRSARRARRVVESVFYGRD